MSVIKKNKKAIEMSLNLIIMLIIGLTLLGLILALITSKIGEANQDTQKLLEQLDNKLVERLKEKPGNFVLSTNKLTIGKGKKKLIYMKVVNVGTGDITFKPSCSITSNNVITYSTITTSSNNEVGNCFSADPATANLKDAVNTDAVPTHNLKNAKVLLQPAPKTIAIDKEDVIPMYIGVTGAIAVDKISYITLKIDGIGQQTITLDVK